MRLYIKQFQITPVGQLIMVLIIFSLSIIISLLTIINLYKCISIIGWRKANLPRALSFLLSLSFINVIFLFLNLYYGVKTSMESVYTWSPFLLSTTLLWLASHEIFNALDKLAQSD